MLSSTFSLVVIVVILLPLTICNIYGTLAFQLGAKSSSSSAPASATQVPLMLLLTNNGDINSNDDDDLSSSTTTMDDIATAAVKRNLEKEYPPMILDPCLEAADFLSYSVNEPVGTNNNGFIVRREGSPTMEELTNANLYRIVVRNSTVTDLEVNTLVWKCLGYRFDEHDTVWRAGDAVFPKWKDKFPLPIDLINMQRIYTKDVDGVILKNNQQLAKSIPHKVRIIVLCLRIIYSIFGIHSSIILRILHLIFVFRISNMSNQS